MIAILDDRQNVVAVLGAATIDGLAHGYTAFEYTEVLERTDTMRLLVNGDETRLVRFFEGVP